MAWESGGMRERRDVAKVAVAKAVMVRGLSGHGDGVARELDKWTTSGTEKLMRS